MLKKSMLIDLITLLAVYSSLRLFKDHISSCDIAAVNAQVWTIKFKKAWLYILFYTIEVLDNVLFII